MNYDEVKELALAYADREKDTEILAKIDLFIRVTEARVNRVLKVQKMSVRTQIMTVLDQEYYGLPLDFSGLRDIEIRTDDTAQDRITLQYLSPEQMNDAAKRGATSKKIFYNIIANQLQIYPTQDSKLLELVYYSKVPALNSVDATNWMSLDNPDVYLFGIMVEISAFVKDAAAAQLWDTRFVAAMEEIHHDDKLTRWSGTSLYTKVG